MRIYPPYGDLVPGMAYLIRRLIENTANESFLRQSFAEHQPPDILLADPERAVNFSSRGPSARAEARGSEKPTTWEDKNMTTFTNEAFTDFSNNEHHENMIGAIRDWREKLGRSYPLVINGERVTTDDWLTSVNPADTSETIGKVAQATTAQADQAVAAARAALPAWRRTPHRERADLLRKTANILRRRRA